MKVLFLFPYPLHEAPSQRFRFEQYFDVLSTHGIQVKTQGFLNLYTWRKLYQQGNTVEKMLGIMIGFLKRFWLLFSVSRYDYIFIHREATPVGPPIIEWLIATKFKKRIIYDFDDAIWLPNTSTQNSIAAKLKYHQKVGKICKWAKKVSVGNKFLAEYARQFNDYVIINPTTIDTENLHNPKNRTLKSNTQTLIIGWTGTHSTMVYLNEILPVIDDIAKTTEIIFRIISNQPPEFHRNYVEYLPWKKETEIQDLLSFDIGIMPLTEDKWAEGKCGFKALQYMSLEIPTLASPVGVNKEIITSGTNGYLCQTPADWFKNIQWLLKDEKLRKVIGSAGRTTVIDRYSVLSNKQNFINLFHD